MSQSRNTNNEYIGYSKFSITGGELVLKEADNLDTVKWGDFVLNYDFGLNG